MDQNIKSRVKYIGSQALAQSIKLTLEALHSTIIFYPLEVVSLYCDPQLQVGKNDPNIQDLNENI